MDLIVGYLQQGGKRDRVISSDCCWDSEQNSQRCHEKEIAQRRYPPRKFFWGIALKVIPEWAKTYIDTVIKSREYVPKRNLEAKTIAPTDNWINKITKHDYISKCKSKYFHFLIWLFISLIRINLEYPRNTCFL